MSVTVTVRDNVTGETETMDVPDGDYLLIATAPCWLDSIQTHKYGQTHVLTIKGRVEQPALASKGGERG